MSSFYTNVQSIGNNILYRGVKDGGRVQVKIPYQPSLYEQTSNQTPFKTLNGEYLKEIKFEGIKAAKEYVKQFEDVAGKVIYGNTRFEYAFIADQHKEMIEWDINNVSIGLLDIEVGSENGFPDPYEANEPVTAITIKYMNGPMFVFGCGDYETKGNEIYTKCKDEASLLKQFVAMWMQKCPDVYTGWNSKFFDTPYLVNRIARILGEDEVKKLSPWNMIKEREAFVMNGKKKVYEIVGVAELDYLELYKWYAPNGKSQESYKLGDIASVELDKRKLSFEEYDSLHQLYKLNFQKYIEYNIVDVELILEMEDKLNLLSMAMTLAYDTKCNYSDVFAQTRMWDSLTYSYLLNKNIIVPPRIYQDKPSAFEGAYVKEVQVGMHKFPASIDLDSMYSHLMMQYNISPETLIEPRDYTQAMTDILSNGVTVDKMLNREVDTSSLENVTLTPNGQFFRTDFQGFLPAMLYELYEDRKKFKKQMIQAKKDYEVEHDETKKQDLVKKIAQLNNLQLAKKLSLNSAYGALGSQYFRFYDLRMASAVTIAGQLSIRWIENSLNDYMNKLLGSSGEDYVIASDTDSIYLRLGELVDKVFAGKDSTTDKIIEFMDKVFESKIQPFIDKQYQELAEYVHAYEQKMRMKREALCDKGIWTAKKRYILHVYNNEGVQYASPKMKVVGMDMIKSSTPAPIREKMKDALEIIMTGKETDMHEFIASFKSDFKKLPPEDVSFPRGINGLEEYSNKTTIYSKGTPIHVKGALLYNNYLAEKKLEKKYPLIHSGEKIKFVYMKKPNPLKDSVISFPGRLPPEFNLNSYIDYDTQFDKAFIEPLKVILDCLDWSTERTNSLWD